MNFAWAAYYYDYVEYIYSKKGVLRSHIIYKYTTMHAINIGFPVNFHTISTQVRLVFLTSISNCMRRLECEKCLSVDFIIFHSNNWSMGNQFLISIRFRRTAVEFVSADYLIVNRFNDGNVFVKAIKKDYSNSWFDWNCLHKDEFYCDVMQTIDNCQM